jgi:chromosome segregation ATPase
MESKCIKNNHNNWKPNYKSLESQLSTANEEIREYKKVLMIIRDMWDVGRDEIPEINEFIKNFNRNTDDESYWINNETDDLFIAREIADDALSSPAPVAPVDEEKARLALELQAYKNQYLKLIEAIENEFQKDGWCRLVVTPDKLQELKEFIQSQSSVNAEKIIDEVMNQARSRIEGIGK